MIKLNSFTTLFIFNSCLILSVIAFHGRVIINKDGSIKTEGINHANFDKKCVKNADCEFKLTAAAFLKAEYNSVNDNLTDDSGLISSINNQFQNDNNTWQNFLNGQYNPKFEPLENFLNHIQEAISNATNIMDNIENRILTLNTTIEQVHNTFKSLADCYKNSWTTCTATTIGPTISMKTNGFSETTLIGTGTVELTTGGTKPTNEVELTTDNSGGTKTTNDAGGDNNNHESSTIVVTTTNPQEASTTSLPITSASEGVNGY